MKHNYRIIGEEPIGIVVEMGLGSCLSEWVPIAKMLQSYCGVLIYERAGINKSSSSDNERTPKNIANELYQLLEEINHMEKLILIAHSQGGLYAQQFCRLYPNLVKKIILLDPLSARDFEFKEKLTEKEYKKSGVDKCTSFRIMKLLAKLRLGFITKSLLKNAPPFYYYKDFSNDEMKDILDSTVNPRHTSTVIDEYISAHNYKNVEELIEKNDFPNIPLYLITHSSELAIEENMKFGGNSKEFATKIECMWQEIMKDYLKFSNNSSWIQAKKSTHYIHLQEPELIVDLVNNNEDEDGENY